jgi:hypothetical protein
VDNRLGVCVCVTTKRVCSLRSDQMLFFSLSCLFPDNNCYRNRKIGIQKGEIQEVQSVLQILLSLGNFSILNMDSNEVVMMDGG